MIAVLIDTQGAFDKQFFGNVVGMDLNKLQYISIQTIEGIFRTIEIIIQKVRQKSSSIPVCIVVDSIAGASSDVQLASG